MRRSTRLLAAAAATALALCATATATATAAKVDPVAVLMQQSVQKALQANMSKQVPGMKVRSVTCTVSKDARRGTCRANFTYKTIFGFYSLKVTQPKTGKPSYASTAVHCFVTKTKRAVAC